MITELFIKSKNLLYTSDSKFGFWNFEGSIRLLHPWLKCKVSDV